MAARFPKPDAIRKLPEGAKPALGLDAGASSPSATISPPAQALGARKGRVEPLSASRYKVQFTASQQLVEKIEHAKRLLSHANPSGELSTIVERAVDLLIADLERKKLGKTDGPRRSRPAKRGTVTRASRRQVVTRDGLRCAWIDDNTGRRCEARAFLEFDHVSPKARGGSGQPDEVRMLCRAHNRLYAEQVYGRELIEQKMHLRYRKYATERAAGRQPANETAKSSAPESSDSDAELSANFLKVERALTQQGFARKLAAHAVARLRERHAHSRSTLAELLREALQILTPELTPAR